MGKAFRHLGRTLTFRTTREDVDRWGWDELVLGLLLTAIVGIGRWWDDPRNLPWYADYGLGSVAYVFVLSAVLWFMFWTLADQRIGYRKVLTFVTFTSPPAIVYAIPVERWMEMEGARSLNFWFLALVALYRLALLAHFASVPMDMPGMRAWVATLLPISIAVFYINAVNMTGQVIDFMGGNMRVPNRRAAMEDVVLMLGCLSWILTPALALLYVAELVRRRMAMRKAGPGGGAVETQDSSNVIDTDHIAADLIADGDGDSD